MADISKETLDKIKEQGIVPRAKGYFLFMRYTVWSLFLLSVILGSIAASAAIFQLKNAEWELFRHYRHSISEFIWLFVPYFWLLFLTGFSIITYYYFRRTKSGYRYGTVTVITLSVLLSVAGGAGIHTAGLSGRMESMFEDTLPFYRGIGFRSRMAWMSPDRGLLAGKIVEAVNNENILLKDLNGKKWNIITDRAAWRGRLSPAPGLEIKIIGTRTGESSFTAREIRPWMGRRRHNGRGPHHMNRQDTPQ